MHGLQVPFIYSAPYLSVNSNYSETPVPAQAFSSRTPSERTSQALSTSSRQEALKRLLINNHIAHCPQLLPTLFLLLQQLLSSALIRSMQLMQHIFPERCDALTGNDFATNRSLDNDFEELAIDVFFELADPGTAETVDLAVVHDARDGVDGDLVDEELQLFKLRGSKSRVFVVEGCVAFSCALELTEEVIDEVREWDFVLQDDLSSGEESQVDLFAAAGFAEFDDWAEPFFGKGDGGGDVGFFERFDFGVEGVRVGEVGGVVEDFGFACAPNDFEGDGGWSDDDVCAVFLAKSVFEDGAVEGA